jgi:ATP-dependent Lhr-like helicase
LGALDADAIAQVVEQAFPDVRSADELHDVLLTLAVVPAKGAPQQWLSWLSELQTAGRASCTEGSWRATERAQSELIDAVRGWIGIAGPVTAAELAEKLSVPSVEAELALLENDGLVLRGRYREGAAETEWCERTLLSRIHSLTLGRLRREVEPVSTQDFLRFLFRWQHVQPGAQLHGAQGLSEVLAQLQGFQVAASAWESDVLPARVQRYDRALLDQLCFSGEIAWGRLACSEERALPATGEARVRGASDDGSRRRAPPGRATPLSLVRREDLDWLLEATRGAPEPLGERARLLLALLEQRGALFIHELRAQTGLDKRELHEALWELVSGGRVTCDGFAALRALLDAKAPGASGRWSLLRPAEAELPAPRALLGAPPEWMEKLAAQYLRRYGVVFRDLLQREPRSPPWRELLQIYRRLEARGEIRGGRFAQAFSGEQFALPEAVEALRAVRRIPKTGEERVSLSACDPLNLAGILTPGARVPAFAQNRVAYLDGIPQLAADARSA